MQAETLSIEGTLVNFAVETTENGTRVTISPDEGAGTLKRQMLLLCRIWCKDTERDAPRYRTNAREIDGGIIVEAFGKKGGLFLMPRILKLRECLRGIRLGLAHT